MLALMERNFKELVRDPLTILFGMGLPILLLGMMQLINAATPVTIWQFQAENFVPAMAVFSLSFVTLFTGMLLAKDRTSAFLMRVFASPLTAVGYLMAYTVPMLVVALLQSFVCLLAGLLVGLSPTWRMLLVLPAMLPASLIFISLGLLFGTVLNDKQVGGICGGVLVNVAGLAGGIWFDLNLLRGVWHDVLYALPFAHCVDAARTALAGDAAGFLPHLWWMLGWAALLMTLTALFFAKRMKSGRLAA